MSRVNGVPMAKETKMTREALERIKETSSDPKFVQRAEKAVAKSESKGD